MSVVLSNVYVASKVLNLPSVGVNGVNKYIDRCFRYITNFLYQKNIVSSHDLQTTNITFPAHFEILKCLKQLIMYLFMNFLRSPSVLTVKCLYRNTSHSFLV